MLSKRYFAWRVVVEAAQADRRENRDKYQELLRRRKAMTINRITDAKFLQLYRLSKEAFLYLCKILKEKSNIRSSQRVSLECKVLSALLFFANGYHQKVVGIANCLSQEAVSRFINQVTKVLNQPEIVKQFIRFPNKQARCEIKKNFHSLFGIPGVIGCVGDCHFRIFKPSKQEAHRYYCKDNYYSLNVQMVTDFKCKILSINTDYGGASLNTYVWENSKYNTYMQTLNRNGEAAWVLGDVGFSQRPWLMTPYSNPKPGSAPDSYNIAHSKALFTIENTFRQLRNRWRCVSPRRLLRYRPEKCAKIITACCVLQNLALDFRVPDHDPQGQTIANRGYRRVEIMQQDNNSMVTFGRVMRDHVAKRVHAAVT